MELGLRRRNYGISEVYSSDRRHAVENATIAFADTAIPSKPMKLVTVWFTEEEKAFLDELAKTEHVTLSKALQKGAQLYFEDAAKKLGSVTWLEARRGEDDELHAA